MPAAISDYLEDALLDHVTKNTAYSQPTDLYVALLTADNGIEAGTLTGEVSGGAYARTTATFAASTSGTSTNSVAVDFGTATAAWGTLSHVAVIENSAGTNVLYHGTLSATKVINSSDSFKFNAGDLALTLD